MSDLIDRQAAISAICNACGKIDCNKMDKCEKLQLPPANSSEFPNNSDTISRQAAIDICTSAIDLWSGQLGEGALVAVRNKIAELPSALGTNLAEVCTDTISRQQAIAEFRCCELTPDGGIDANYAIDFLKQLPSAQPEIIRCKDCKYWIPYDWMFSEVWQSRNIADYSEDEIGCKFCDMTMKANDFCSRAERREVTK